MLCMTVLFKFSMCHRVNSSPTTYIDLPTPHFTDSIATVDITANWTAKLSLGCLLTDKRRWLYLPVSSTVQAGRLAHYDAKICPPCLFHCC
ncbi:hypothetical protein Plhal304r1_c029g0095281 [Plasmopara halstedii]